MDTGADQSRTSFDRMTVLNQSGNKPLQADIYMADDREVSAQSLLATVQQVQATNHHNIDMASADWLGSGHAAFGPSALPPLAMLDEMAAPTSSYNAQGNRSAVCG